ncbi:MAG: hypothetical protein ACI82Q_001825, partial [Nonlabens sp.]
MFDYGTLKNSKVHEPITIQENKLLKGVKARLFQRG